MDAVLLINQYAVRIHLGWNHDARQWSDFDRGLLLLCLQGGIPLNQPFARLSGHWQPTYLRHSSHHYERSLAHRFWVQELE